MAEEIVNINNRNYTNRTISESSDTESDPQFKPIVNLPEVDIVTNEENETVLLKIRAKLYRFDRSNEQPEWKERGTGEMKLLRHNEKNSVRLVMRRDKTFKVCANHFITPWMSLKPCFGNDKAYVYTVAADFADEQLKSECLAIKFGSVDNANLFKTKFEEAKYIVTTECELYNGECDKENEYEEVDHHEEKKNNKICEKLDNDITKNLSNLNVNETSFADVLEKVPELNQSKKTVGKNTA